MLVIKATGDCFHRRRRPASALLPVDVGDEGPQVAQMHAGITEIVTGGEREIYQSSQQ